MRQQQNSNPKQQQHHHDLLEEGDGHDDVDNFGNEVIINMEEEDEYKIHSDVDNTGREEEKNNNANSSDRADLLSSKRKIRREGNLMDGQQQQYDNFLIWCQDSLGIDVGLVEIDDFDYPNYLRAMEDRIDIFCDDCNADDDDWVGNDYKTNEDDNENSSEIGSGGKMKSLDDDVRYLSVTEEYPPVSVRGLKASRDIEVGEVVLSIPHEALWTVHNAIDASGDPDLVESMGPAARQRNGWESPGMDEIPLLAITVLYHMDKAASATTPGATPVSDTEGSIPDRFDHGPYLEILEQQTNKLEDMIPHLWSSRKLRRSATPSIRNVAKAIRKDVVELYESIVMVLIESHPAVFGNHRKSTEHLSATGKDGGDPGNTDGQAIQQEETHEREWMFSLEKFHWAFALVSSRHWHLNIPDDPTIPFSDTDDLIAAPQPPSASSPDEELKFDPTPDLDQVPVSDPSPTNTDKDAGYLDENHESSADQDGPPAATPTDEWVGIQDQKLIEEQEREMNRNEERDDQNEIRKDASEMSPPNGQQNSNENTSENWPQGNSFLAPLADLLNFGPPCTRGFYNHVAMAFEIVATCEFRKGQEITFWYADACEDVFMANYGFTMPMMVHKCADGEIGGGSTNDEGGGDASVAWQQRQQEHQQQYLEDELHLAYQELDRLDRRLEFMLDVIDECHCGNQTELFEKIWNDEDPRNHDNDNNEDRPNGVEPEADHSARTAIGGATTTGPPSGSPAPPKREGSQQSGGTHPGGGNAVHAIRNGRNNRGGSFKGSTTTTTDNNNNNNNNNGNGGGNPTQQQPPSQRSQHRRHHHSTTRTQPRRHQGRRNEF